MEPLARPDRGGSASGGGSRMSWRRSRHGRGRIARSGTGRCSFHTRGMSQLDASDLATERLIDWLRSERLAVRELAGAAVAYGAATDQSYAATARRIASCVATLQ